MPKMSDFEYEINRDKLIPHAERYADKTAGPKPEDEELRHDWGVQWNIAFHKRMEKLAQRSGLYRAAAGGSGEFNVVRGLMSAAAAT